MPNSGDIFNQHIKDACTGFCESQRPQVNISHICLRTLSKVTLSPNLGFIGMQNTELENKKKRKQVGDFE